MSTIAGNSLKRAEAIALNAQGKGFTTELGDSSRDLYRVQLKQRSSLNLKLNGVGSNSYAELIQDRNRNARIDRKEILGRSQLSSGANSLKVNDLKRGTYFVRVNLGADRSAQYQLVLSAPQSQAQSGNQRFLNISLKGLLDLFKSSNGRSISSTHWNGGFINRTSANVDDYDSYNFSRPVLVKDLGGRGKRGKTLARLKLDYGNRSPGEGVQSDNYAMQAWTRVSLKEGRFYQIKSDSNDGTRFFFRDRKTGKVITSLNGDWQGNSSNSWTQLLNVPRGAGNSYDFYVQHYDRSGTSSVNISLEEVQPTARVITTSLNLRSQPSTVNNTPITALNSGTNLKILRKVRSSNDTAVPEWYEVSTSGGRKGYVAAQSDLVELTGGSDSIVNLGNGSIQAGNNNNNNNGNTPPRPSTGGSSDGKTNQKGVDLIKSFEGLSLTAYRDPVGVWTIGYGTTTNVKAGMRITTAQAEEYLKQDLLYFERAVKDNVKVSLNSDQFAALVSFTYNVGSGALQSSTLLRLLNQGDYQGAADQLLRWNKGDGVELPGLTRRRKAERAMFLGQDYTVFL
jgi:GH24 family phage-related lysozyme (muramidase)